MSDHKGESPRWLDNVANVKKLVWALVIFGIMLFLADTAYHKHVHFPAERFFGFYAIFGFGAFAVIVLAGKYLRNVLMRPEDYYDKDYGDE